VPAAERKIIFATQGPWAKTAPPKGSKRGLEKKALLEHHRRRGRMINPELQRAQAKTMKATTLELNSSHVPMVSQPDKVAALSSKSHNSCRPGRRQCPPGSKIAIFISLPVLTPF
jgi:hypothetical protein